jgi:hypothetical protein
LELFLSEHGLMFRQRRKMTVTKPKPQFLKSRQPKADATGPMMLFLLEMGIGWPQIEGLKRRGIHQPITPMLIVDVRHEARTKQTRR